MRLVMGGESLKAPLTGIGQYTLNLATEILLRSEIVDFTLLAHGFLRKPEALMDFATAKHKSSTLSIHKPAKAKYILNGARNLVSGNRLAVKLYGHLVPLLEQHALQHFGPQDIYHSPNFMLPSFPGRRVVSILDLSTFRFPQHHPKARVQFVNGHIKKVLEQADHIITISNSVRNELVERFKYPQEKTSVTYLGADNTFRPHSRSELKNLAQIFGLEYKEYYVYVASIEPRKNLDRLLDAFEIFRAEYSNYTLPLIVAGSPGWKSQHTHNKLKAMAAKGIVRYLGYVDQSWLPSLVAGARASLYPSLYEGFGLPVLEAMQSGTAVMTSKKTAMAEVGGSAVMQVDPNSTSDMVEALHKLSSDNGTINSMELDGLDRAKAFSWRLCAEQTLAAYQSS